VFSRKGLLFGIHLFLFILFFFIMIDTPDAVNLLLHRIKKNTSANMDQQGKGVHFFEVFPGWSRFVLLE